MSEQDKPSNEGDKHSRMFRKTEVVEGVREALASYAHEAWSGWMRYLFSEGTFGKGGTFIISKGSVLRWRRQMETPYAKLPEGEKRSDQNEADKMLALMQRPAPPAEPEDELLTPAGKEYMEKARAWKRSPEPDAFPEEAWIDWRDEQLGTGAGLRDAARWAWAKRGEEVAEAKTWHMAAADERDAAEANLAEANLAEAVSLLDDVQNGNKWWSAIAAFVEKHKKSDKGGE